MKSGVIGIDLGSSGCKVTLIDPEGKVLAKGGQAYQTDYPHPGWAEQNPTDWERAVKENLARVLDSVSLATSKIECLAISGATHTVVCLDKDGLLLRPAILWTDKRTIREVEWLKEGFGSLIVKETLHAPNVNWTLPYLIWIRRHEPDTWSKIDKILMPKDYVRYRLTGIKGTDWMDAHGTLLLNVLERKWSEQICRELDIPRNILPDIYPPTHVIGKVNKQASSDFGIPEGVPVIVGTTDQACEAFGTGTVQSGSGLIKLATAGNLGVVTDRPHPDPPHVYAYYHLKDDFWYTLSGTSSCAVSYQWIRNLLFDADLQSPHNGSIYTKMDGMASMIPVGSEGLIFHPFFQGSLGDPYLKACFLGLTLRHGREHLLRAVLEGVAFSLYECLLKEETLGVKSKDFRIIGGGAKSVLWREIMCNLFGREMTRVEEDDSSFGTALLAGLGIGFFRDVDDAVRRCVKPLDLLRPDMDRHQTYQRYFEYYRATLDALKPSYHSFHALSL